MIIMDFLTLAKERYSVRKFSTQPIEKEKLEFVLKAGQLAPTSVNLQPQRILVINDETELAKLWDCTHFHFNAPAALLVCYDKTVCWHDRMVGGYANWQKSYSSGNIDASIVATHMILAATSIGLGTCWVMGFYEGRVREVYDIPDNYVPVCLLPIGYPAEDARWQPGVLRWHDDRVPLDSTVFYNTFT